MYTSIRKYKVKPGSTDEICNMVNEEFVPIISKTKGFLAYYCLEAGKDIVASVSVFQNRAGAEESNKLAADWVKKNLSTLITTQPEITAGEIKVHHGA